MDADRSFVAVAGTLAAGGATLILCLLAILLLQSFAGDGWQWTWTSNYVGAFTEPQTYRVLWNSIELAVIATALAFFFGLPIAWLVERTNLRGKATVVAVMLVSILVPGFASAMGWLFLLHPKIGLFHLFNVVSVAGMGVIMGFQLAPVAFLMTGSVLRAMDRQLEEAAFTAGAPPLETIRRVVLPLARPALVSAAIYVFIIAFGTFDVPAIIGWSNRIFTFSTYIFLQTNPQAGLPDYGRAGALSVAVLIAALALTVWTRYLSLDAQRYAVVTGKAYQPRLLSLGRWTYVAYAFVAFYLVAGIILPLAVVVWESFLPFVQAPSPAAFSHLTMANYAALGGDAFFSSLANSVILMTLVPLIVLVFSFAFTWIGFRTRFRGRTLLDGIAFLPHAVPSVIMAVGVIIFSLYFLKYVVNIYGTIWIMVFAFAATWISYGTRMTNASLLQLHRELEESAAIGGASTWAIVREIVLPLMSRGLLLAWIYLVILSGRELTLSVMLTTPGNTTVPAFVWTNWLTGGLTRGAAVTICYLLCLSPLIVGYSYLMNRTKQSPAL
ncbi:MAG TPA: iron ABC transporter permease [Candidatus Binatia bacterium]|nr:iron ABC transporter permease [Candidatus Binatia bacterium]